MKNDVKFTLVPGGLGRLPATNDHISAIIWPLTTPTSWEGAAGKKYLSVEAAEADGITKANVLYTELWYQISEFFRIVGVGELWVVNKTGLTATIFNNLTEGKVRQAVWHNVNATLATEITAAQTFADAMDALFAALSLIMNAKDNTTTFTDIHTSDSEKVSVICFGDGSAEVAEIVAGLGVKYIPALGATLGLVAFASVHENIGWPRKFVLTDRTHFTKIWLPDGSDLGLKTDTQLQAIADFGYIFARKIVGISGFFIYDTFTAITATDDYSVIEHNRVIDKAKREIRSFLIPDLMSPLYVDAEGKLSADTIAYFKAASSAPLERMQAKGEISGFRVLIDPDQDVLTTSKLVIVVKIQPVGVAREINVNIGFAVNLTA
jgi:hypothetical protein